MSELVKKMRAFRAELVQRDRDEVAKRFAGYVYRNVEPDFRDREVTAVFRQRSEIESCFDGTNKAAREWLLDQLRAEKIIRTASDGSGAILMTHEGAESVCLGLDR